MANGPGLSTASGGEIYVGSEIRDSVSLLNVLYANQFEGESFDPADLKQTEENFYRGAPPTWLNFHISEQAESKGTGTPFIKRDGCTTLVEQINQSRQRPGISAVKLFHQPGCGGTTLAMQVLWDLRKSFRCAVLTDSTSDITHVAKEVVNLFTAGSRGHQNTVLLLLSSEQSLENLQESIMKTIAEQKIKIHMTVAILLSCVRKEEVVERDSEALKSDRAGLKSDSEVQKSDSEVRKSDSVVLKRQLSDTEKENFNKKREELSRRYSDKYEQFHGFNIMQTNFSQAYVKAACSAFSAVRKANRPLKTQLAAFLSLLNAYVPGSYLLESQCLDFFKHDDFIHAGLSLEDRLQPFSHLIVIFQPDEISERRVAMAHPMIAQACTELMAEAGVTRSDTARNLLTCLCKDEVPPCLIGFVKDMLTKREMKKEMKKEENPVKSKDSKEEKEMFSRLILDIQKKEKAGEDQSASVLKVASKKFQQNPFFPQALARVYYIEIINYNQAEKWAEEAKKRDPQNSFVADTVGQVHKNHLNHLESGPREILQLATKAIEAFKHEERLAENECGPDMTGDGMRKVSHVFNTRGQFGYLQVCNILYDRLVSQDDTWGRVLTKKESKHFVQDFLRKNKVQKFQDLINSLRDDVERKCAFFDKFLTYSKLEMKKNDASYISRDTTECYRKYVGDSPPSHIKEEFAGLMQKLKQNLAETSAGVLSCLDRKYTESELKEITTWWEEIYSSKDSLTALTNYILAHIMLLNAGVQFHSKLKYQTAFKRKLPLSPNDAPELHMLALMLHWPTDSENKCVFDLSKLVQDMRRSYEQAYETYFRSRYLRPLFFIGKGQDLNRIVHRKVLEGLFLDQEKEEVKDWSNWNNEKIFLDPKVQERLLRVEGVIRNYTVYATVGGTEIAVDANLRNRLWKPRSVSFYLGFTIRGPVAFGIQTKAAEKGPSRGLKHGASDSELDSSDWPKLEPEVNRGDEVHTYSLQSEAGQYECSVSALRWVCKEKVSFQYQFCSWEEHMRNPLCQTYMPAGPLLDITVTAGTMEEVHLPHWIDHNSKISDMFAILHVDACGDFVGQVSEVTPTHIKLFQPTFSLLGVIIRMKLGFSVRVFYDVLIYKTKKEFLTLHVYLVPPDHNSKQKLHRNETSHGSIMIQKPSPDQPLQMLENFFLKTDRSTAEIQPRKLQLRYDRKNFFEVFIRNADSDFSLKLESGQNRDYEQDDVWTCTVRKGDYRNLHTDQEEGKHFVDLHRIDLVNRVRDTSTILDKLLDRNLISHEAYDSVRALKTTQDQMRDILKFMATQTGKDALYEILKRMKSLRALISELEGSG